MICALSINYLTSGGIRWFYDAETMDLFDDTVASLNSIVL